MVFILDCSSEIDVHVWSNLCYVICFRHLFRSRAVSNISFFLQYTPIVRHTWATSSNLGKLQKKVFFVARPLRPLQKKSFKQVCFLPGQAFPPPPLLVAGQQKNCFFAASPISFNGRVFTGLTIFRYWIWFTFSTDQDHFKIKRHIWIPIKYQTRT